MPDIRFRPHGYPSPEDLDEAVSYVPGADPYVRCPVSAYSLERNVVSLCDDPLGHFGSKVHLHPASGRVYLEVQMSPSDTTVTSLLPLRLGPLKISLDAIARSDSWLLARTPVFYTDQHQHVHIDFPGLAGYTVEPGGTLLGRAVNPY